ncbi:GntR family transcriptional regulator [Oleidesulfovibrio alaskensis]|jgi:DNA-binding GntR family transcriptional regulator|uniref:GntR family transcriptional regulator n=1 Tax=Oleidesulfovibrio alaskensis TaxID=58180 RepID=UPI0003F4BDB6|nr:GntR family transcriptional regulator [Oleidesulfovibrio alaskensis]
MKTVQVKRESLKEQVRRILHDKIISGELVPGERLKIVPISEALQVSQAPVREAIQCLITSGHLEHIPNVGVRVRQFSTEEVREIYEVRQAVEVGALKKLRMLPQELATALTPLQQSMEQACAAGDFDGYIRYNNLFHRQLVKAANNNRMLQVWDSLHLPQYMKHTLTTMGVTLEKALPLHPPVIEALRRNELQQAVDALEHHYHELA